MTNGKTRTDEQLFQSQPQQSGLTTQQQQLLMQQQQMQAQLQQMMAAMPEISFVTGLMQQALKSTDQIMADASIRERKEGYYTKDHMYGQLIVEET